MEPEESLDRLVGNALDFLNQSIKDFECNPKYSVINFYSAVELFLKARLMADHWSLVVAQIKEADWKKFAAGDFRSVSLDDAADRLNKISRSGLIKQEIELFKEIRTHRNKMVHFFHGYGGKDLAEIAREQLRAWYFLHGLLINRWKEHFDKWLPQIKEIDSKLRGIHTFLQIVFDQKKNEILNREQQGSVFRVCPSCIFRSQEHRPTMDELYEAECLVCGLIENYLRIECDKCDTVVYFSNEGFSACEKCEKQFEPENIIQRLWDSDRAYKQVQHEGSYWDLGNCGDCDGHTVVLLETESYFCVSCFTQFDNLTLCEWCQEPHTGDIKDSYYMGCGHCDGCWAVEK